MPGEMSSSEVSRVNAEAEQFRLSANLAQMQFLEDARHTVRQMKRTKPGEVQ